MIDQTWIGLMSAFTALIASVVAPTVTLRVARQQFRANVLSVNRQKWIESTRDAIAELVGQLQAAASIRVAVRDPSLVSIGGDPVILVRVEALIRNLAKIELLLNPIEADHQVLLAFMRDATSLLRRPMIDANLSEQIDAAVTRILETAQVILKREWTRVKNGQ